MLEKIYSVPSHGLKDATRYRPAECCGTYKFIESLETPTKIIFSTSYVERMNLQIRMNMRRFTRLTNAHSKKIQENHVNTTIAVFYCSLQFRSYPSNSPRHASHASGYFLIMFGLLKKLSPSSMLLGSQEERLAHGRRRSATKSQKNVASSTSKQIAYCAEAEHGEGLQ